MKLIKGMLWANIILLFCQCNKPGTDSPVVTETIIFSITPTHGPYNTIDTINGSGFDPNAANDSVFFNGHYATILNATSNRLIAQVPSLAGTGNVTVKINSKTTQGPVFKYDTTIYTSTFAGNGTAGFINGTGIAASFNRPAGITIDNEGNIYVADYGNAAIRKITPAGAVSTLYQSVGALYGLVLAPDGNFYATDVNIYIWKITPQGTASIFAGTNQYGTINGPVNTAAFKSPIGIAVDAAGNFYISDENGYTIRKISNGIVSTLAGDGTFGGTDGPALSAKFWDPRGIAVDANGTVYIADGLGHNIRKLSGGNVTTFAGSTEPGDVDGIGTTARFGHLNSIYIDPLNNLVVPDIDNDRIRKVTPDGTVTTYIMYGKGDVDGPGPYASVHGPHFITFDKKGNGYFSDYFNNKIRKIEFK
jgi:hypothetical protein